MTDLRKIAEAMLREDAAVRSLGVKLEEIRLGFARASMRVTRNMVNGQGVCHGGLIFMLADSTFRGGLGARAQGAPRHLRRARREPARRYDRALSRQGGDRQGDLGLSPAPL